ncbi:MAG TPA: CHASE3 domain-containing protein [Vicinamibacteria bacterium]|nr:CHASE3 domain-containing protein [Vicinamibacteria bacterium]
MSQPIGGNPGGHGVSPSGSALGPRVRVAFALGLLALIGMTLVARRSIHALLDTSDWVAHTHEVLATLAAAEAEVSAAESARRGFALTGVEGYLDRYESARTSLTDRVDHLASLTMDNPNQRPRIARLRAAVAARLGALQASIALRRERPDAAARQAAMTIEGEDLMREVRAALDDMGREESTLLTVRERQTRASARHAEIMLLLGTAVGLLTLGGSAMLVDRQMRARQHAQAQVLALNDRLQSHVDELTAVNQELESFSYSVSHDLRAPVRHIHGFVDLLQRRCASALDDTGRRHLTTIAGAAQQMGQLIDDLLAFSRMGRADLSRARVPLASLVTGVIATLAEETRGRDVVWNVADLPVVVGDPPMLRVVFTNLLSNAVKYTRTRIRAEIEVNWRRAEDGQALVWVRDNGVGFDMQYVGKLFGVFSRLHRATEFEGTGIGLATVRRIVHRHGGRAWAEGAVDAGATVSVSLPLFEEIAS